MSDLERAVRQQAVPVEGGALPSEAWTFDMVQDRLVEAMITCWRHADRERGWQRLRSAWPEVTRERAAGDYDARGADGSSSDVALRPASLTRREIGEMEEAFGWAGALDPVDRRIVALAVAQLARGQRQVRWSRMLGDLGMTRGSDGLRVRYGRALASIAAMLNQPNGGKPRNFPCSRIG